MKWINRIAKANSSLLSQETRIDGRLLVLLVLSIYFFSIFVSSFFTNYDIFWNLLGVPAVPPPFWDLRVITSGFECHRLGYDVLISNPCNPGRYFREVNYPRIWMSLAFLGLGQQQNFALGMLIILMFFCSLFLVIPRLNYAEALVYSFILCSPSVMLGIERANNDLIIFSILSVSTLLLSKHKQVWRFSAYFIILFAAILKLYPIFSLVVILKERRRIVYIFAVFLLTAFGTYVITTFHDIQLISSVTPRYNKWSYGYKIIFNLLLDDSREIRELTEATNKALHAIHSSFFITGTTLKIIFAAATFVFFLTSIIATLILLRKKDLDGRLDKYQGLQSAYIDTFRLGAGIYIGTFLLGNNWAYRLIFLIFTTPQIIAWVKFWCRLSFLSNLALIGIILTLWMTTVIDQGSGMYFHQLIDWYLFFYFICTFLLTLPNWLQTSVFSRVESRVENTLLVISKTQ